MTITTERKSNGFFAVLKDGQPTKYVIQNGCQGMSGNGVNLYGIRNTETDTFKIIGSLAKAKKVVAVWAR